MERGEKLELSAVVQGGQTKAQGGWQMLPSKIWEIFPKMSDVFREMSVFFEEMSDIFEEKSLVFCSLLSWRTNISIAERAA